MLVFCDGSTISVSELPSYDWIAREIKFSEKTITWLAFIITSVSLTIRNIGLAEMVVVK